MWEDTVMTSRDAVFDPIQDQIQRLLNCQAKISFKAGHREVVEWIEENSELERHTFTETKNIHNCDWQAKLKEWGL